MDIHAVCRICLKYLQNDKSYDLFLVPGLAEKLYMCTSLSVEPQDGFPKNICGICYTRLSDFADFQKLCVDSVQRFQDFLANNAIECAPTFDMDAPATATIEVVQMLETVDKEQVGEVSTKVEEEKNDDSGDNDRDEDFQFPDIGERCDNDDDSNSDDDKPLSSRIRSIKEAPATASIEDVQMPEDEDGHLNFDPLLTNHKMEMIENEDEFKMLETVDKEDVEEVAVEISDESSDNDSDSDEDFQFPDIGERSDSDDDSDIDDDKPLASRIRSITKEIKENEKPETDNIDPKIKPKSKKIPAAELNLYRIIECHICHQKFKEANTYEKHMKYHNDKLPFQCEVENCKRNFTTASALRVHTLEHTSGQLPFPCNICGKRFKFNRALKDHVMKHADKNYLCPYCGVCKTTREEWKTHVATHHTGQTKCQYCGKQFTKAFTCKMHEMTHTGETRYECKVCGKGFIFAHDLTKHLKTHVNRVWRAIEVYRKRQVELGEVSADDVEPIPDLPNPTQESHQKLAEKILKVWADFVKSMPKDARRAAGTAVNPIPQYLVPKIKTKMKKWKYTCPHCGQGFKNVRNFRLHLKDVHQRVHQRVRQSVKKRNTCRYCHKRFNTAQMLKYHEMTHTGEKPHACSLCDKRFILSFTLKRHMKVHQERINNKSVHQCEKKHACRYCHKRFNSAQTLKYHEMTHTGEKPHACSLCDKRFIRSVSLQRHIKVHHERIPNKSEDQCVEKPACRYCHKPFASDRNLKYHEMRHTGERPHACSLCDMSFNRSSCLKRHLKVHQERPTSRRNEALAIMPEATPKERLPPGADISIATNVLPSDLVKATNAATTSTTDAENTEKSTSDIVFKIEIQENDIYYSEFMDNY